MREGELQRVGNLYKLHGRRGWAIILARLLVGFLDEHRETFSNFDLIMPSPAFLGEGAERDWDHTAEVVRWAADAAGVRWPFVLDPVIIRETLAPPFKAKKWAERKKIAETDLRASLKVVARERVKGKRILVYDDIFTDGLTLREVGRALRRAGAVEVCGVTLTRQPFRPREP